MSLIPIPVRFTLLLFCTFSFSISFSQVGINTTNSRPDSSAMLDVQSTSKGMLIPRMNTSQLRSIQNPAEGLMVYDTDKKKITTYSNRQGWQSLDVTTPGRFFISNHYPDTLYPDADYEYYGFEYASNVKRNFGYLPGSWVSKSVANVSIMSDERQYCYTGFASNKLICIGGAPNDSAIVVYDLSNDTAYKETTSSIRRYKNFTATIDTANNRIFVWGGWGSVDYSNPNYMNYTQRQYDEGLIYNYVTGAKTAMDSVSAPLPYRRVGHTAIWAANAGKLFIYGGQTWNRGNQSWQTVSNNNMHAYNPASNSWITLAPSPLSPRYGHLAVYDNNDRIIIWGGYANYPIRYFDGAVYTISTNTWTIMSTLNAPDTTMSSASWTGTDMILSNQGVSPNHYYFVYKAYKYNLANNSWFKIPDIPQLFGKFSNVTINHIYDKQNNRLLQLTDLLPSGNGLNEQTVLWSYSVAGNTWIPLAAQDISGKKGIMAGSVPIFDVQNSYKFFRFSESGSTPSYSTFPWNTWYYYRKK